MHASGGGGVRRGWMQSVIEFFGEERCEVFGVMECTLVARRLFRKAKLRVVAITLSGRGSAYPRAMLYQFRIVDASNARSQLSLKTSLELSDLVSVDAQPVGGENEDFKLSFRDASLHIRPSDAFFGQKLPFLWELYHAHNLCYPSPIELIHVTETELRVAGLASSMYRGLDGDALSSTRADSSVVGTETDEEKSKREKGYRDLISETEEADLMHLAQTYQFNVLDTDSFTQRLEEELLQMEKTNVYLMLENEDSVSDLLKRLEHTVEGTAEFYWTLQNIQKPLRGVESDILYLQRSNANREKKFEHDSLVVETLDSLMSQLDLPSFLEDEALNGDVADIECSNAIIEIFQRIEVCLSRDFGPKLRSLAAVSERCSFFRELRSRLAQRVLKFLTESLHSLGTSFLADQANSTHEGSLCLNPHFLVFSHFDSWIPVVSSLLNGNVEAFEAFRTQYSHVSQSLYRRQLISFFTSLKKLVQKRKDVVHLFSTESPLRDLLARQSDNANAEDFWFTFNSSIESLADCVFQEEEFSKSFFLLNDNGISTVPSRSDHRVEASRRRVHFQSTSSGSHTGSPDGQVSGGADRDPYSVFSMSSEIFSDLLAEANRFMDWLEKKTNRFHALDIVAVCLKWMELVKDPNGGYHSNFLLVFLGEIHSRANQIFSTFMEAEVNHINHFKKAIKRSGVIPCVEFTPLFVEYAEGLVAASSSSASELSPMDISYLKIVSAVRDCVDRLAQTDEKYADFFKFLNWSYLVHQMPTSTSVVLSRFMEEIQLECEFHFERYASWLVTYTFGQLFQIFFDIVDFIENGNPRAHIQFRHGMTRSDIESATRDFAKHVHRNANQLYFRLEKHCAGSPTMLPILWSRVKERILEWFFDFSRIIHNDYENLELVPSVQELDDVLKNVERSSPGSKE